MTNLPTYQEYEQTVRVQHCSYSSITTYIKDQYEWYDKYVNRNFNRPDKPSTMIGKACHEAIEFYRECMKDDWNAPRIETFLLKGREQWDKILKEAKKNPMGIIRGKKRNEELARDAVTTTLQWYYENTPTHNWAVYNPVYIEAQSMAVFEDFDGNKMPVPLKSIMDLVHQDENKDLHGVDHKCLTKGYVVKNDTIDQKYDIQAGCYFVATVCLTGKPLKTFTFDQVVKGELSRKTYKKQAELRALCEEHGLWWEKYDKNADLENKLYDAGVFEEPQRVYRYTIDFEATNYRSVEVFLDAYRYYVADSYMKIKHGIPFFPNPDKLFNEWEAFEKYLTDKGFSLPEKE